MAPAANSWRNTAAFLALLCASAPSPSLCSWQDQGSSQSPAPPPKAAGEQTQSAAAPERKKPKKVWTNDNMAEVRGNAISQVGDAKNDAGPGKPGTAQPASAQAVASFRKQLAALEVQQASVDKQITDLKNFNRGEAGHDTGLQLHKSYNTESVDVQVRKLGEKRKQLAALIDAMLDAARKKGIEPGQLR